MTSSVLFENKSSTRWIIREFSEPSHRKESLHFRRVEKPAVVESRKTDAPDVVLNRCKKSKRAGSEILYKIGIHDHEIIVRRINLVEFLDEARPIDLLGRGKSLQDGGAFYGSWREDRWSS